MKLGTTLPTIATVILQACKLGHFPSNNQPLAEEHQCFCWPSPWHWYQNFVWQRSCPMQILQVLTEVSGCLANALNCKSSGLRFKSWTLQGEELGFVFFFSSQHLCKFVNAFQANTCANLSVSQCLPSQHLCKSVSVFQANICANLSMSSKSTLVQICQHLSSQHLCKSVSIFQAKTCADLSASFKPNRVQICQHLSNQHLCKSVSILQDNTCKNLSVSASSSYALCTLKTLHRLTHSKYRGNLPPGNCTNTAFSARTLNINYI